MNSVVLAFVAGFAGLGVAMVLFLAYRSLSSTVRAWIDFNDSLKKLASLLSSEQLMLIPKLIEGHMKVAEQMALSIDKMVESVDKFRAMLYSENQSSFTQYSDDAEQARLAEEEELVQRYVGTGMPESEARDRARSSSIWKNMSIQR